MLGFLNFISNNKISFTFMFPVLSFIYSLDTFFCTVSIYICLLSTFTSILTTFIYKKDDIEKAYSLIPSVARHICSLHILRAKAKRLQKNLSARPSHTHFEAAALRLRILDQN